MVIKRGTHRDLSGVGLRTFGRIAEGWGLNEAEQTAILSLNLNDRSVVSAADHVPPLSEDTLLRLSYIFRIYRAINTLLPAEGRAAQWMRSPGKVPMFEGRSAIETLTTGHLDVLRMLAEYLEAQCQ